MLTQGHGTCAVVLIDFMLLREGRASAGDRQAWHRADTHGIDRPVRVQNRFSGSSTFKASRAAYPRDLSSWLEALRNLYNVWLISLMRTRAVGPHR